MGALRQSFNLLTRIGLRNFTDELLRHAFQRIPNARLVYEDTAMPWVCKLIGHSKYNAAQHWEKPEYACRRCHQYLN